jgi:C4-dicarboxylate-binding protein DctP
MTPATFRAGGYQGAASVHTKGLHALAATIEAMSEGAIRLAITPDITGDGSRATELLTRVEQGSLDLCYFASSYLAARVPALGAFDLPFAAADRVHAYHALDGQLGFAVQEAVADGTGFTVLAFWDNGFRHLSNRLHPIAHPRDCQGLRIRTLDNAGHQAIFRSFGFQPIAIDVRDLADAVRLHTVDAQENPLTNTVNFRLQETHRFHSLTSHFFGVALLLANTAWLNALPEDARSVLEQSVAAATVLQRETAEAEDAHCLAALTQSGCAVLAPHEIDLAAFRVACLGLRKSAVASLPDGIRDLL